jgi:hypothetical protein
MLASAVPAASAAPTITQAYSCVTSLGTLPSTVTVTGKAAENASSTLINLKNVVFKVKNTFGQSVTVDHVKVSVADPNATSAPYVTNSAGVGATPPGWTAGHDATGAFALFAGSKTVANGAAVANAPLKARYKDKGPAGTVITFMPGHISFNVTAPITTSATCTPTPPVGPIATVME